jgi:hypothetical protein
MRSRWELDIVRVFIDINIYINVTEEFDLSMGGEAVAVQGFDLTQVRQAGFEPTTFGSGGGNGRRQSAPAVAFVAR